ncbi:hypothetical protein BD414DRAFT_79161 [Trametes punicea]|nr:hypothetical protein BD414DRAFT_79161 [Trametes punicea]
MSFATDSRVSPFTVKEFSDLVSSAFNLHDADRSPPLHTPVLSLTPPSPQQPRFPPDEGRASGCGSDGQTDEEHHPLRSPSLDESSPQPSPLERRSRSRTITALRMFHHVRTRASAFVLGPRARSSSRTSPSPVPYEPIPPLSISPTLIPTPIIPFRSGTPLSMADLELTRPGSRPRSRAESLPRSSFFKRETTPPPPLPGNQARPSTSSRTCSTSPGLRSFFDDSPATSQRAYSRPSTSSSTVHPLSRITTSSSAHAVLSVDGLPSFFEDTGYQIAKPVQPYYCRPSTPTGGTNQRIHTRLPPLRKAKSGGYGLFNRGSRKGNPITPSGNSPVGLGYSDTALWAAQGDPRAPSPLTCPREPPPVPEGSHLPPQVRDSLEDIPAPPPPSYVFERRGSATSNSTASSKSSSSLSSRISSIVGIAFSSKVRVNARSKLNLSITTGAEPPSAHSSPSTLSTLSSPTTPVSPTCTFPRSQPYVFPGGLEEHAHAKSLYESEEDVLAIGRVLTPEEDPFAKAEIAVPIEGTPRPPTPPVSRRASSQQSPPTGLTRTQTWDEDRAKTVGPTKRTRNSMPASPVSAAYTFPSTCSVYRGREPSPFTQSPPTPKRYVPPSAWSPFSTPAASCSSLQSTSTPPSTPARSPSSRPKSEQECSSPSPPSPTSSAFPLPPRTIPVRLPPPDRALPSLPSPPSPAPPVPPKDRHLAHVARAHKSLPPSPRVLESSSGSPSSMRSYGDRTHKAGHSDGRQLTILPLRTGIRDISPNVESEDEHVPLVTNHPDLSSSSLGAPWSGGAFSSRARPPATTPPWLIRPVAKRRSVDSVSTVTASPTSSALHEAMRGWEPETSAAGGSLPSLGSDTRSLDAASSVLPSSECSTGGGSDCCRSATSLTTFYSARESLRSDSPVQPRRTVGGVPDSPFLGVSP